MPEGLETNLDFMEATSLSGCSSCLATDPLPPWEDMTGADRTPPPDQVPPVDARATDASASDAGLVDAGSADAGDGSVDAKPGDGGGD